MTSLRPILIVPGFRNSGPDHWQTRFESQFVGARRVNMPSFDSPLPHEWVAELDRAIAQCDAPPVLVAHSLGCIAVAHWSERAKPRAVHAGLLVAPCDVEQRGAHPALRAFAPMPFSRLRFRSVLVASTNDPYMDRERAGTLARAWGARLNEVENAGHLNAASGHGPWPAGEALLTSLLARPLRNAPAASRANPPGDLFQPRVLW
jgi:predicted alpha/beta hydrolase family esterase